MPPSTTAASSASAPRGPSDTAPMEPSTRGQPGGVKRRRWYRGDADAARLHRLDAEWITATGTCSSIHQGGIAQAPISVDRRSPCSRPSLGPP